MAEIKVTPSELESKADMLDSYNKQFRNEVEKMVGYEQQLAGMWEGESQRAFRNAFNTDKQKMDAFAKNIDLYVAALREDATRYSTAEQAATGIATQRKS